MTPEYIDVSKTEQAIQEINEKVASDTKGLIPRLLVRVQIWLCKIRGFQYWQNTQFGLYQKTLLSFLCLWTCLNNMKTYFAFFTVLKNQTMVL